MNMIAADIVYYSVVKSFKIWVTLFLAHLYK